MKYCYTTNENGFRCFCAVGGEQFCVNPPNPNRCRFQIQDEEQIHSESGHSVLRMVFRIVPPEVQVWLLDNNDDVVAGPFATPDLAQREAHRIFKKRENLVENIPVSDDE